MHGIHSPFVYGLVSEGFYYGRKITGNSKDTLNSQAITTLFKTINYFKSFKLIILGENADDVTEAIRKAGEKAKTKIWFFSPLAAIPGGPDMGIICGHNTQTIMPVFKRMLEGAASHTIFVLPNIHATAEMEHAWEAIKKDPNVTVTIDTYHLGLIFFHKGQAKQHFIIRAFRSFILDAILGIRNLWGLIA